MDLNHSYDRACLDKFEATYKAVEDNTKAKAPNIDNPLPPKFVYINKYAWNEGTINETGYYLIRINNVFHFLIVNIEADHAESDLGTFTWSVFKEKYGNNFTFVNLRFE
ncbi:MAG: hypothetical protein M0R77_00525 [Gammaproteobacteria bacterium]|nr:hypothetical protein [Acholeplasmataceae bacterium]MCK9529039.1 hypothetical protein [Gammaproteobacteria bacterium]